MSILRDVVIRVLAFPAFPSFSLFRCHLPSPVRIQRAGTAAKTRPLQTSGVQGGLSESQPFPKNGGFQRWARFFSSTTALPLTAASASNSREAAPLSPVDGEAGAVTVSVGIAVPSVVAADSPETTGSVATGAPVDSPGLADSVDPADEVVSTGSVGEDGSVDSEEVGSVDSVEVPSVDEEVDSPGVVIAVVGVAGFGFSSPISSKKAAITRLDSSTKALAASCVIAASASSCSPC